MSHSANMKNDPEFWRKVLVDNCKMCNAAGVVQASESEGATICRCMRLVKYFVKMNDPIRGVRPQYHKFKLDNLEKITTKSKICVNRYLKILSGELYDNPYRNAIVRADRNCGKSSIAAIIYKHLMIREYDVSIFNFSELLALSKLYLSNPVAFNEKKALYELLKDEEFIIIEDVGDISDSKFQNRERLGYSCLDELFSYRANHHRRATIITTDLNTTIDKNTLGRSFFQLIYNNSNDGGKICELRIVREGEKV